MLTFKYIITIFIIAVSALLIAYYLKLNYNYKQGYNKGRIDMALEVTNKINLNVNNNAFNNKEYKHFMSLKDIDLYIYEKNGCRTIVRHQ